ncbi:MAG: hypothetical protein R3C11_11640 [Planctomycetaceae bacterium]
MEFTDHSVYLAQLSPPDMKLPIQYALTWPERWEGAAEAMDWSKMLTLGFHPPDLTPFRRYNWGWKQPPAGNCRCGSQCRQ